MKTQRTTTQRKFFIREIFLSLIFALAQVGVVYAQTSTFTYQGRFTEGGTAANGTYDMQFTLFDGTGNQIGQTITNNSVAVTNGVFTVQLDYGAAGFTGADRLLEIGVRRAGSGEAYTVLSPRQPITSAPYAIRAGATTTADTATNASQLGGIAASEYVQTNDSRLTDTRTPSAGSSNYIQNTNSQQVGNFNITGNGTTGGTLSANVINVATQYNVNGNRVLLAGIGTNTFVGSGAGSNNLSGQINTFVGRVAGTQNTDGNANSFFGAFSGTSNTTAGGNSFFGFESGHHSTGSDNSFFGVGAGAGGVLGTGSNNAFFGANAGRLNTTASENAFFGASAGRANTTGVNNSFFGADAGRNNSTAKENSFFGHKAGRENSGDFNSFFGANAGTANTNGGSNSFFGSMAGEANTTGEENSYFGASAGSANQSGNSNTFFGYEAGRLNTAGRNSFFGAESGKANTTGERNTYFGTVTGVINSTTSDSSFFGYASGVISRAASNSFFGSRSGEANITGFANSFFGFETGGANSAGFNNAFFGRGAGKANVFGDNNTLLGTFADVDSASLSFATAIGSGAHVGTSNTIVLGRANASDGVRVPGTLTLSTLGTAGAISLCRNVLNQLSTCSSSLRYKKDLAPFTRGLALLNQLKPITFRWKADDSSDLGFGAEEIAAVEPLLVTRNDKGEIEGVKYDRITAVLVNAVKEQQAQIERQQSEIASLKRLICPRHRNAGVCK